MTTLNNLKITQVSDILSVLPEIEQLDFENFTSIDMEEFYFVALGFEERCPWISELLSEHEKYKAAQAIYFEYQTNQDDNDLNKTRLVKSLESFASNVRPMDCDNDDFPSQLRTLLSDISTKINNFGVTFDISSCSSKLIVTCLTIFLEYNVKLRIVYSEAKLYHPTHEEFKLNPEKWTKDEGLGVARGVSAVTPSPDHPGSRRDNLPEAVIVFPTFKPERSKAIIANIDPSLGLRPDKRVIWIIGRPHLQEDHWRAKIQREINQIDATEPNYEVSTFDYKKSLEILDKIYQPLDCKYHVNIAPLGSKLQCIGTVFFLYIRPEISVIFASPREYNAEQYSEGCKAIWCINFGALSNIRDQLDKVGEIHSF